MIALTAEIEEYQNANDFTRKQIDLLAAFIWRHENKTGDKGQFRQDQQVPDHEIEELDDKLTAKFRLKMCMNEKDKLAKEVLGLEKKAEKDQETLKAVLEECRLRIVETKKSVYDLRRDIVIGSKNTRSGKVNAEKLRSATEDRLKMKRALVKKYKSKNASLTKKNTKLQENLKAKAESDGDSLHSVDLDQLKIQNTVFNQKRLERNKELLKLKMVTGKMVQVLNTAKHELAKELKRSAAYRLSLKDLAMNVEQLKCGLKQEKIRPKETS